MAERVLKPEWYPGWHPQDQQKNLNAIWEALEVLLPPEPEITTDLDDEKTATVGSALTLTIACESPAQGTLTYQWEFMQTGATTWANVASATSASYTISTYAEATHGGKYRCKIVNTFNNVTCTKYSNVCAVASAA